MTPVSHDGRTTPEGCALLSRLTSLVGGITILAIVVVAVGGWYFFFRDDSPDEVSLDDAVASVQTPDTTTTAGSAAPSTATVSAPAEGIEGEWTVAAAGDTFVGYRVQEELGSIGATTAVGRTSGVTGTIVVADGAVQAGSTFVADLTTLESDRSQRDNQLRTQAIETNTYPEATFTLDEAVALPDGFESGTAASATLRGTLELHGVTQTVEIPVEAQVTDGLIVVVGSTEIQFADYGIEKPRAALVLSVEDHGTLEFQLVLGQQ